MKGILNDTEECISDLEDRIELTQVAKKDTEKRKCSVESVTKSKILLY